MRVLAMVALAAVQLGGGFGEASARVDELGERSMIVDIQVEVAVSASAVVAHLAFGGDPVTTIPLLDRGGGVFGARTELEPKNYRVVFEAVGSPPELSDAVSLTDLGADLAGEAEVSPGTGDPGAEEGLSQEARRFGWLALALAAASLAVLAVWALGERETPEEVPGGTEEE